MILQARFPFFPVFPDTDMSSQPTPPVTAPSNPAPAATTGTVNSMTGYAHQSADTPLGRLDIEIRAVNSRFTGWPTNAGCWSRGCAVPSRPPSGAARWNAG